MTKRTAPRRHRWKSPARWPLLVLAPLPLAALDLSGIGSGAWSILLLMAGFSLVIFVHELGHFLAAKWAGVKVDRFAIGFGKELIGFTRGETRYSLNALPLGGYVKMLGQEDFVVDKSGELKVKADARSFTNKPISKRMVIVSAGVIMNLIFAAIAFGVVVMVGRWQRPAVVGMVVENSPAGRAGLQTGDRIAAINGAPVESFEALSSKIVLSDPDEVLTLDVIRDGKRLDPPPRILPEFKASESIRQVGISAGMNRRVLIPSIRPKDDPQPDDLQKGDELVQIVRNGKAEDCKDLAEFRRAMIEARGAPIEAVVRRPVKPDSLSDEAYMGLDPQVESREVKVRIRAQWAPLSQEPGDVVTGSLLGLVPRLTVLFPDPDKSLELAGVKSGDIVTRIGSNAYPNYATFKSEIEAHAGEEIPLEVRRPYAGNHGLSGRAVGFCTEHRESFIAAARKDVKSALQHVVQKASEAGVAEEDREKIKTALGELKDAKAWRRWFEAVDVHKLAKYRPKRPFALVGEAPAVPVDGVLRCMDEDHLVVADVLPRMGERVSPAKEAGIPIGAVILAVNGQPVRHWYELSEAFRKSAGKSVEVTYRVADDEKKAAMRIPMCVSIALDMPIGSRISRINGRHAAPIKVVRGREEKEEEVALPDWRAVEKLLSESIGRTAEVEWVTWDGERRTGSYAVTAENADPWLARVMYPESFMCYPLVERYSVRNPIQAVAIGFRQAYEATLQTIQSVRHMLFTRQVGLSKVSGPVGIFRVGAKFADNGILSLLWFLAIISANLAVINFLPMPIVDGGLFLFLLLEKIRGEPVSIKTQVATQLIGIALIATVFVLVTYQDIKNWITGA